MPRPKATAPVRFTAPVGVSGDGGDTSTLPPLTAHGRRRERQLERKASETIPVKEEPSAPSAYDDADFGDDPHARPADDDEPEIIVIPTPCHIHPPCQDFRAEDLEAIPSHWEKDENGNFYPSQFKWEGDVDFRRFVYQTAGQTDFVEQAKRGLETEIPMNCSYVVTQPMRSWQFPKDFPDLTAASLQIPEPQGDEWLPNGRASLLAGIVAGTVPREATKKKFSNRRLGLEYALAHAIDHNVPEEYVVVCPEFLAVRRVPDDEEMAFNTDDSSDEAHFEANPRFNAPEDFRAGTYGPIVQTPAAARAWDQRMAKARPLAPIDYVFPADISNKFLQADRQQALAIRDKNVYPGQGAFDAPANLEIKSAEEGSYAWCVEMGIKYVPGAGEMGTTPVPKAKARADTPAELAPAEPAERAPQRRKRRRRRSKDGQQARDEPPPTLTIFGSRDEFVLHADCECPEQFDYDWTDLATEEAAWRAKNYKRNLIIQEALLAGNPVQYVSSGNSLAPLVMSQDTCYVYPVNETDKALSIKPGDIVFCCVRPRCNYYTHLVWNTYDHITEEGVALKTYVIGNNKPGPRLKANGWCLREHIFGIVVRVKHRADGKTKIIKGDGASEKSAELASASSTG